MLYVREIGFFYLKLTCFNADWRSRLAMHLFWPRSQACWDGVWRPHLSLLVGSWAMKVSVMKVSAVKQLEGACAAIGEPNPMTLRFLDPNSSQS